MKKIKKFFFSALTFSILFNFNIPANSTQKEVKVYSGRHYNTDRSVFKKFAEETGIKVRLIEAAGISLIERLKREGKNSQADVILLVDAARITNAAKADLLQSIDSENLRNDVLVNSYYLKGDDQFLQEFFPKYVTNYTFGKQPIEKVFIISEEVDKKNHLIVCYPK